MRQDEDIIVIESYDTEDDARYNMTAMVKDGSRAEDLFVSWNDQTNQWDVCTYPWEPDRNYMSGCAYVCGERE